MRVVISLSNQTKQAAEAQAYMLGYASLAALLKVTATLLAGRSETKSNATEQEHSARERSLNIPKLGKLPHPDQFKEWPPFVSPTIATIDPDLYAFYIQTGIIR